MPLSSTRALTFVAFLPRSVGFRPKPYMPNWFFTYVESINTYLRLLARFEFSRRKQYVEYACSIKIPARDQATKNICALSLVGCIVQFGVMEMPPGTHPDHRSTNIIASRMTLNPARGRPVYFAGKLWSTRGLENMFFVRNSAMIVV